MLLRRKYRFTIWGVFFLILFILIGCKSSYKYSYEKLAEPVFSKNYIVPLDSSFNSSLSYDSYNLGGPITVINDEHGLPSYWSEYNDDSLFTFSFPHVDDSGYRVVSYNIEFAENFEEAIDLFKESMLKDFDVLLLQEIDEHATDSLAKELKCVYVFYPTIFHPKKGKNVGNAILSKWPIVNHRKLILPNPAWYPVLKEFKNYWFRKMATVAEIYLDYKVVAFYSTHGAAIKPTKSRGSIAKAISDDINRNQYNVGVVAGDFNTVGMGDIAAVVRPFKNEGLEWATKSVGQTIGKIRWMLSFYKKDAFQADHIFTKGFTVLNSGKVVNNEISDHYPVWVSLKLDNN